MYSLNDSLLKVPGIGEKTLKKFKEQGVATVKDFLLYLPLRYEDRSHITTINRLLPGEINTVKAQVVKVSQYFNNRKRISNAVIKDDTGQLKCIWFNNRYIRSQLKTGSWYFFSGKYSHQYKNLTQPKIEEIKSEQLHTGRLVPLYSQTLKIKQGNLRRFLKKIVDGLKPEPDVLSEKFNLMDLSQALAQLHFPDEEELVVKARKRLALEELLSLMQASYQIKQEWQQKQASVQLQKITSLIPDGLPFELTDDQQQSVQDIIQDLKQNQPMNRLLIGDVGSGKTVVAGIAARQIIQAGQSAALIAPTQILAEQHLQTFAELFPDLKTKLLTAKTKNDNGKRSNKNSSFNSANSNSTPKLVIGTHAVINHLQEIKPGLIIYDEQHRFGVAQRAEGINPQKETQPHLLTMTATPIPRSYMLTIFSHLDVSLIKQMPFGPKPLKTWYVPDSKKQDAYDWLVEKLKKSQPNNKLKTAKDNQQNDQQVDSQQVDSQASKTSQLGMVVCPFIDPSEHEAFSDIPAAAELYDQLQKKYKNQLNIALLHGRQKPKKQEKIIKQLFNQEIDLLVSTTIVEVGVDLPQANIMLIEGADRFGLASLHQLRGRVGRQGQESYCVLFSSTQSHQTNQRLKLFAEETDGLKLAELDLQNRGAGDLFGLQQHGLDQLRFASWNNAELIIQAKNIFNQLEDENIVWEPLIKLQAVEKIAAN